MSGRNERILNERNRRAGPGLFVDQDEPGEAASVAAEEDRPWSLRRRIEVGEIAGPSIRTAHLAG
jgi:hypothetical protein